jgi:hypothetical protein
MMDRKFAQLAAILVAMTLAYSILSTPGDRFSMDVLTLKRVLLWVLLALGAAAVYLTYKTPRRPPPPGV